MMNMRQFCLPIAMLIIAHAGTAERMAAEPSQTMIHIRSVGEGADCWVLLHPFGASGRFWEGRAAQIAVDQRVRVYVPDLPSHGASRIVDRFDYADATNAVRDALAGTCPRPRLIVGASSGGIVAMKLGAATGAPVAAVGVGWSFSNANIANMNLNAVQPPDTLRAYLDAHAEQRPAQTEALLRHFADLATSGTTPFLTASEAQMLRGRLLILYGENDDFFLRPGVDALVAAVPEARLETFPGAGHLEPFAPANAPRLWRMIYDFAASTQAARP